MKKICIATYEIENLHKNGGIGTAYKNLAIALAAAGHDVTIFVTSNFDNTSSIELKRAQDIYAKYGIRLMFPKEIVYSIGRVMNAYCSYQAYRTFESLKDSNFDILHIPDSSGDGYFIVHAKKSGLFFQKTTIVVGAHGSSEWVRQSNEKTEVTHYDLVLDHLERDSIRYADYVVSPSNYYIGWMKAHGFSLPEKTFSILNCPDTEKKDSGITKLNPDQIKEIVFFGRQEKRKGFDIFCEALLLASLPNDVEITILGKPGAGVDGAAYRQTLEQTGYNLNFLENFNSRQALKYLRGDGIVAVIPSRSETMSYTVMECLLNDVPFVASRAGAIQELIDPVFHDDILFQPTAEKLAEKLEAVCNRGIALARPSFARDEIVAQWMGLHEEMGVFCDRTIYPSSKNMIVQKIGEMWSFETPDSKQEFHLPGFDCLKLAEIVQLADIDNIYLAFEQKIPSKNKKILFSIHNHHKQAIVFSNFISDGAYANTSGQKENFELILTSPFFQFYDKLSIPTSCIVHKQIFIDFLRKHQGVIADEYYFMKIFICFLQLSGIVLHAVPIALGWSRNLTIDIINHKSEKFIWIKYYKNIFNVNPEFLNKENIKADFDTLNKTKNELSAAEKDLENRKEHFMREKTAIVNKLETMQAELDRRWIIMQMLRDLLQKNSIHFEQMLDQDIDTIIRNTLITAPDDFDEEFYLSKNQDVKDSIAKGQFPSAYFHYIVYGRKEKRLRNKELFL